MRPDELIRRMLCDDNTAILFDRRNDVDRQALSIGYELQDCVESKSPIGDANVKIALVRPATESLANAAGFTSGARQGRPRFIRLMDRFLLPAAGDPVISSLFFELIAERYEELTATDINLRTARALLGPALAGRAEGRPWKVLDFGCGTGFALSALKVLGLQEAEVELVGTDLSDSMLSIARGHGEVVVSLADWRAMPCEVFDAAISCFVLHYGVPADDLGHIGRQLKPGGIFSANLFKGDEAKLTRLMEVMKIAGLDLESSEQSSVTPGTYNRHLMFRKHDGRTS
jgi:SAM-dependent methyltransferase